MQTYTLKICGLERELPIVPLGPKLKIASFNLLGDGELVETAAQTLAKKLKAFDFDTLVGPEVKVVPLLQALSQMLGKPRYVVLRKKIHGYMVKPLQLGKRPTLVLDGPDAEFIRGKKVAVIDDVVSTGQTLAVTRELVEQSGGGVAVNAVILRQGENSLKEIENLIFLGKLPFFKSS